MESALPDKDGIALMAGLADDIRARLLQKAVTHRVPPGTILFEQGDSPTFQHLVLAGSAHLMGRSSEGREVLIEIARPGDLVIPAAVVTGAQYLMQARVPEPSRFLLIEAEAFRTAVREEPALASLVIQSLSGQFRRMVRQIKNLKLRSSVQRVGSYILALSQEQDNRLQIALPYEKNLIASELGMTRETFSRMLGTLQDHGISVNGDAITINDRELLRAVSGLDPLIDAI